MWMPGPGERVLLIDDLLATGGTAEAAATLVERSGGVVVGCGFIVDLPELGGRQRLEARHWPVFSLCEFEGE
jgi:adenine phosphoribosyltransferase